MKDIKAIIWDWNGTLLNDVAYSVDCINMLLSKRAMPTINVEQYKNMFTFPVKKYYELLGFNFKLELWEEVAIEFMQNYWYNMDHIALFADVIPVLDFFRTQNISQYIVSAMENAKLNDMVQNRKLSGYFKQVLGINNHFASSKAFLGNQILEAANCRKEQMLWIGDTYHDYEVASSLGVQTHLLTCGHQSEVVLAKAGVKMANTLGQLFGIKKPELT